MDIILGASWVQKFTTPCVKRYGVIRRTWQGGKRCVQSGFQSQYLPEGLFEINETPGIHCSVIVEPIHCSLLRSVQARQRNEFFIVGNNIPPHLIIFNTGNLLPKEKKTPKWLVNYWLITWLSALLLFDHYDSIVCSLYKRFSTSKTLWWGGNIWADNKMLKTLLNFYQWQKNLMIWSTYNWGVNTHSLVDLQ